MNVGPVDDTVTVRKDMRNDATRIRPQKSALLPGVSQLDMYSSRDSTSVGAGLNISST